MRHTTAKGGTALSEAKKQNYLHGAAIMVGTTVIVKIAAFFYKLPLGSMKLLEAKGEKLNERKQRNQPAPL